jgi:aldose sugar dehydrogenase
MKVPDTQENASRCMCPGCPTYDDCMRGKQQRLFCSRDKTDCGPKARSCICGECPVWNDYDLGEYYFCLEGSAE